MNERFSQVRSVQGGHHFALPKGARLHEFQIESVLGHGGFGITYGALDTALREVVAIKEFFPNELAGRVSTVTVRPKSEGDRVDFQAGLEAFIGEARLITRFRHSNIVHVRRFFEMHETGYIVLDYERGQTLAKHLGAGSLPEDELRAILLGVLDGLDAIHAHAILHRDLKPSNIIIRDDGSPVLIDFGAARDFKQRHSRSVTAIAAPGYSPPEQYGVGGQQGPWTDIYALGAIAYRCVTGSAPPDSLRRIRSDVLVPAVKAARGKYSSSLLQAIDWMLAIEEGDRPASAQQVRDALAGRGGSIRLRRTFSLRRSGRTWGIAASLLIVAGLSAYGATDYHRWAGLACGSFRVLCGSSGSTASGSVAAPETAVSAPAPASSVALAAAASVPLLPAQPGKAPDPSRRLAPDEIAWNLLRGVADADQLKRFVEQFPSSPHKSEAVAALSKAQAMAGQ
ncbi:MAG TPA: serine/threonine-protein kinase [Xanthobacteraceae bacterium]